VDAPPDIVTARLLLRSFLPADAPAVAELAGDKDVASTTAMIPHPYPPHLATEWIASHPAKLLAGMEVIFAVTLREMSQRGSGDVSDRRLPNGLSNGRPNGLLIGAIGLMMDRGHSRAEMGYWIGKPFWGHGYATEAARAVIGYGFDTLALHRIFAHHMNRNPASGRVLEKAGMKFEGELRQHFLKWGKFEDERIYGILRTDHRP